MISKILIIISILWVLSFANYPKDITGKWVVEKVDVGNLADKMTSDQKAAMTKMFIQPLTNATIEFKPDHHFYLSANFNNMPKDDYWEYNPISGSITVFDGRDRKGIFMKINVIEKDGSTYFTLHETPVILKMLKK